MRRLHDVIVEADQAGFDLWVIDHLLTAPALYGLSWLEPLSVLTYAAGITRRARLGTGILVAPLRNPVLLAKEIASIDYLSGGRFILGVGTGWYAPEYEATGSTIKERGSRTDELLDATRLLLSQANATYEGHHYRFDDVTLEPRPEKVPPIWISGGARVADPDSPDVQVMAPKVLDRIAGSDGWISRSASDAEAIGRDWAQIRAEVVRRRGEEGLLNFTFAHCNFIHAVDTNDESEALAAQKPSFMEVMGDHRPFESMRRSYLLGTPEQQQDRLREMRDLGCEYVILGPTTDDPAQIELIQRLVLEPLESARAGR
jgi:probable F420-dependent oxidoreductase